MYHELTETHVYMREGLFEKDESEVPLEDILGFMILQTPFFKFFGLGTVLLITDPDSDLQPCIKCIPKPEKLLRTIRRQAIACGANLD